MNYNTTATNTTTTIIATTTTCESLKQIRVRISKHRKNQQTAYTSTLDGQLLSTNWSHAKDTHEGYDSLSASVLPQKQVAEIRVAAEHLFLYALSQYQSRVQCAQCLKQIQTQFRLQCSRYAMAKSSWWAMRDAKKGTWGFSTVSEASTHSVHMLTQTRKLTI